MTTPSAMVFARPARLALPAGVTAVFAGRLGGISDPPFGSLNTSAWVGDERAAVEENRRRVRVACRAPEDVASLKQVHGARVVVAAAGGRDPSPIEGDALATRERGLALLIHGADCPALFLWADGRPALALAHCGWRGIRSQVVEAAVAALDSPARSVSAFVGPCIQRCCYRVGEDLRRAFGEGDEPAFSRARELRLDLPCLIALRLERLGLRPERIEVHADCTSCRRDLYFSHRAEGGTTGRNTAMLWMK